MAFFRFRYLDCLATALLVPLLFSCGSTDSQPGIDSENTAPTSDDSASDQTKAPNPTDARNDGVESGSKAWIDPLVLARFNQPERQRVIVEMANPLDEVPQIEGPEDAIVEPKPSVRLQQKLASLSQTKNDLILRLDSSTTDTVQVVHWYEPFSLFAIDATAFQVQALAAMPDVVRIHADREESVHLDSSLPAISTPWFHKNRAGGSGTSVAVLDTPVRWDNGHFGTCSSPGSAGCVVAATANFSSQSQQKVIEFEDANNKGSHGTNVAAIIHGVAPEARLLALNVFNWNEQDNKLSSRTSDQVDALAWVAKNASKYGIVAVNMSIGGTPEGPKTCNEISRYDAVRTLWVDHGIVTVISSGNDGQSNAVASPGCLSLAMTVGAQFDTELQAYKGSCTQSSPMEREIACFSNLSGMVDILAPGVFIDAGGYRKSGTSMAAPHVAGAVAAWQSWFLESENGFKSPFWIQKRMLIESSAPHVHKDGRRFQRLAFDQSVRWSHGISFPYWYREASANRIPSGSSSFETNVDVTGKGWKIQGAYLALDIVHESPQHVEVTLIAPNGKSTAFKLPSGQAHFSGVVGRTILPGALASLAGASVDGTWTLRIRDTVGTKTGNYLQGALYFTKEGCSSKCHGESCGDDTCGGTCGPFCVIDGTCRADGDKNQDNPCQACVGTTPSKWSNLDGVVCNDGDSCTVDDQCLLGECKGVPMTCPSPGPCELEGVCNEATGKCDYDPVPNGLACSDDDLCTDGDSCLDGICVGTPVKCSPAECMQSVGCDELTGECIFSPRADGTACPLGVCKGGSCVENEKDKPSPVDAGSNASGGDDSGDESGGCGCRMSPRFSTGRLGIWLLGLGALTWGRRRRRWVP